MSKQHLTSRHPHPTPVAPGQAEREASLQAVAQAITAHGDLAALFRDLTAILRRAVAFDFLHLGLYDPKAGTTRLHLTEASAPDSMPVPAGLPEQIQAEDSPTALVWQTQRPLILHDDQDTDLPRLSAQIRRLALRTICLFPLTTPRQRLGALGFSSRQRINYEEDELAFLGRVAQTVALAVENALNWQRLQSAQDELTRERDRLRMLLEVSNAVNASLELGPLLVAIAGCVRRLIGHELTALWLPDPPEAPEGPRRLRACALETSRQGNLDTRPGQARLTDDLVIPVDGSPSGEAFRTGRPVLLRDDELGRLTTMAARRLIEYGARSFCAVPLRHRDRSVGVLSLIGRQPDAFPPEVVALLEQVAGQVAVAVANALAYRRISELTGRLAAEKFYLEEEIRTEHNFEEIIGNSPGLRSVLKQVEAVAPTDSVVLVQGETGTGKELIARAVHRLSRRADGPFVKLNCAAIPTGLLESELFGHEKGAFTGAIERRLGRFEVADGGTLFLDEVGDIPLELQPKLLRVLQEQEFERLGSTKTVHVNVRLVAATHRDLARMAAEGQYRSDLYYRLHVFPVRLPALRERQGDIPVLVRHFVRKYAQRLHKPIESVAAATMAVLKQYSWPGNVRELEHLIERAVILAQGTELHLPADQLLPAAPKPAAPVAGPAPTPGTLQSAERELILRTLQECRWVIGGSNGAAARLGLKRTTLLSRMDKLGIRRPK